MNSPKPGADNQETPTTTWSFERLEALAQERVRQGLALPAEAYSLPFRNQFDWSQFPLWARPIDPEVFCESGHEG
jgi:hypothetical protein